jgi:hypothetical protein
MNIDGSFSCLNCRICNHCNDTLLNYTVTVHTTFLHYWDMEVDGQAGGRAR